MTAAEHRAALAAERVKALACQSLGGGVYLVASATQPGTVYNVTCTQPAPAGGYVDDAPPDLVWTCSCQHGRVHRGGVCRHIKRAEFERAREEKSRARTNGSAR